MKISEVLKTHKTTEVDLILGHVLNKPKEFLYINPEYKITTKQFSKIKSILKRREKGEPLAYIIGYKDFYGLRFKVNKNVLIPRPETEWLIDRSLDILRESEASREAKESSRLRSNNKIEVLDLGTGSGCIAISIAKGHPFRTNLGKPNGYASWQVWASDVSGKALAVAKQNAKAHKAKIRFVQSNLLANFKNQKFDLVIANLPYVPAKDYKKLYSNLKYEPKLALTDGTNSFKLYQNFFKQVEKHLKPNATILVEMDPLTKNYITKYQKKYLPKASTKFYRDLNKLWRYAEIKIA